MTTSERAPEILNRAADLIEERGWFNDARDIGDSTTLCAALAIDQVGLDDRYAAYDLLMGRHALFWNVVAWNDEQETAEAVVSKMRDVAARALLTGTLVP